MDRSEAVRPGRRSWIAYQCWGFALALFWLWPLLRSGFHQQDDHEEAGWLGKDHALPWSDIWHQLMSTEVGQLGHGGRFRPAFYLIKLASCAAFGDHPGLYYGLRIAFFGLFLGCLAQVFARLSGPFTALLLTLLVSGLAFWDDVWTLSLGPAEQIAVFGLAIMLLGGTWFVRSFLQSDDPLPIGALPITALGAAIASGSKENFFFFVGIPLLFTLLAALRRRLPLWSFLFALPSLLFCGLTLYALFSAGSNQTDFYGSDNSVRARLHMVFEYRLTLAFLALCLASATAMVWFSRSETAMPKRRWTDGALIFLGLVAFFALDLVWELFFYNGRLPDPDQPRYDFLYRLLPIAILSCFVGYSRISVPDRLKSLSTSLPRAFAVLTLLHVYDLHPTYSSRQAARWVVADAANLNEIMRRIHAAAGDHPGWPLIFEAADPWDYEAMMNFPQWQAYYDIPNPLQKRVDTIAASRIRTPFEHQLVKSMSNGSIDARDVDALHGQCLAVGANVMPTSTCPSKAFLSQRVIP